MHDLLILPVAATLAGLFLWSVHTVGRWLVTGIGLRVVDRQAAHLAAGLTAYLITGLLLGAIGWFRWPLLAGLAVLPGLATIAPGVKRLRQALAEAWAGRRPKAAPAIALLAIAITYLAAAAAPSFHYDLLVNYLGVPKDYLIQGHLGGLDYNVHSGLSLVLHVFNAYLLALSEPLNRTGFLFGTAPVWGALHLIVIAAMAHRLQVLAATMSRDSERVRLAAWLGLALWLSMPQTLLLALLESADFLTTYLALAIAGVAVRANGRDDGLTVGALCGVMIAAKPQLAMFGACAIVIVVLKLPRWRGLPAAAVAALLPALAMLRNLICFGSPLFPYHGGAPHHAGPARALLAENAIASPDSIAHLIDRAWELSTLQPETGITLVAVLLVLFARVRSARFWLLTLAALLIPVLSSSNAANVLRWAQPGLVLLLLAAAVNLIELSSSTRGIRWAATGFLMISLWLAVSFLANTAGPFTHLTEGRDSFLSGRIPSYTVRHELMRRNGRVLWLGELFGYYGAIKGPIPAPQNGSSLEPILAPGPAEAIRERLLARGIRWIYLCELHRATGPDSAYWQWLEADQRRAFGELLASLPTERPRDGITIYDLGGHDPPPTQSERKE